MHGLTGKRLRNAASARLPVAEDGEALLERELEPVAARDAVAGPVVEVLVRDDPLHPLEVEVRGCRPPISILILLKLLMFAMTPCTRSKSNSVSAARQYEL